MLTETTETLLNKLSVATAESDDFTLAYECAHMVQRTNADIDAQDQHGFSTLDLAVRARKIKTLETLSGLLIDKHSENPQISIRTLKQAFDIANQVHFTIAARFLDALIGKQVIALEVVRAKDNYGLDQGPSFN